MTPQLAPQLTSPFSACSASCRLKSHLRCHLRSHLKWQCLTPLISALCLITLNSALASPALEALCVRRQGPALIDREERVTLTRRYGSWTLRVHTERAQGFGSDVGLALVTHQEASEVMSMVLRGLRALSEAPVTRPYHEGGFEVCPPLTEPTPREGVEVWVSVLERAQGHDQKEVLPARWLTWRLHDPARNLNPAPASALAPFEALRRALSPRPPPHNVLLTAEERGQLLVRVPRPTRLLIDGVDYGLLGVEPLVVAPGRHTLTLYTLSPPYGPFQYRGVEVERGKLTRLSLDLD